MRRPRLASTRRIGIPVGVGPWPGERGTAWPTDPRYDAELLEHGDRRNVVDAYRYWTLDAIVADLDARRHPFSVAIENWQHDLNIGSIVRTANAFLAATVHIVGRRRWNRRGAMVTDRYQHVLHHDTVADLVAWAEAERMPIVAVDNVPGSVDVTEFTLPGALHPAVRARGSGPHPRGGRVSGCRGGDPPVRLDPLDQCGSGGSHRDARVGAAARPAVTQRVVPNAHYEHLLRAFRTTRWSGQPMRDGRRSRRVRRFDMRVVAR